MPSPVPNPSREIEKLWTRTCDMAASQVASRCSRSWSRYERHTPCMTDVTELRVALTVDDFDAALALYRDALGLHEVADWTSESGRVVVLSAGRATLELFDEAQAAYVDS